MSRHDRQRLDGIVHAMEAIDAHLLRGPADDPLSDGLVFDAVRVRLIEIGEAVKDLEPALLERKRTCRGGPSRGCATASRIATSTPTMRP